jgi:hypothetical protein
MKILRAARLCDSVLMINVNAIFDTVYPPLAGLNTDDALSIKVTHLRGQTGIAYRAYGRAIFKRRVNENQENPLASRKWGPEP